MARYKVMAICGDSKRSKCLIETRQQEQAVSFASQLVQKDKGLDYYGHIAVVEIPDKSEDKPYRRKETVYKL